MRSVDVWHFGVKFSGPMIPAEASTDGFGLYDFMVQPAVV